MREVILQMSVSLDGFVASPNGGLGGGSAEDDELISWKLRCLQGAGVHIMGRVTYEQMASHWPNATGAYAPLMNNLPKVVFSSTMTEPTWAHTQVAGGELAEAIAQLKQEPGGSIIAHGGAAFVQALSRQRLIDEYHVVTLPVALGAGLALFKDLRAPLRLELREARSFPNGSVAHVYRPIAEAASS